MEEVGPDKKNISEWIVTYNMAPLDPPTLNADFNHGVDPRDCSDVSERGDLPRVSDAEAAAYAAARREAAAGFDALRVSVHAHALRPMLRLCAGLVGPAAAAAAARNGGLASPALTCLADLHVAPLQTQPAYSSADVWSSRY